MKLNTSDPLKAHSDLGAQGWQLETIPDDPIPGAVGLYSKGEQFAYLCKAKIGFALREVGKCDECGRLAPCRDFARQTNPQYGRWCEACFTRWQVEVTVQPMAYGGMLSTGWGDESE